MEKLANYIDILVYPFEKGIRNSISEGYLKKTNIIRQIYKSIMLLNFMNKFFS